MAGRLVTSICNVRALLLLGAVVFVIVQMRLFVTQSEYADAMASAIEFKNHCTSRMCLLIDQIGQQMGKIVSLEGGLTDQSKQKGLDNEAFAAVVIMACNRADYLERTIKSVLRYHGPVATKFHLFISQDGNNGDVRSKVLSFPQFRYLQHLDSEQVRTTRPGEMIAYYKIANHYKWALSRLFDEWKFKRVIILEDDMEIAPDFFEYFEATGEILERDRSLIAVSSWNDNGQEQFVQDPEALHRSDFFPGLGWMLTKDLWQELSPKWPRAYWDDWLRLNETRKGRQFIRPEICRTYNFGEHGSSLGQFFKEYLERIKLNQVPVKWRSMDLSYLLEKKYNRIFCDLILKAVPVSSSPDVVQKVSKIDGDARIEYADQAAFVRLARQFGVFEEWKDGVPRTAYKGVVMFRWERTRRIFLMNGKSQSELCS